MRRSKRFLVALHVTAEEWIERTAVFARQSALWADRVVLGIAGGFAPGEVMWRDLVADLAWRATVYQPWGSIRFRESTNHVVSDLVWRAGGDRSFVVRLEPFQMLSHPDRIRDCVEFNPNSILGAVRYYMADDESIRDDYPWRPLRVPVAMPLRREETWENGLSAMPAAAYETGWPRAEATFDLLDYSLYGQDDLSMVVRPYQRTP